MAAEKKRKVLVFIDWYLPGFRAGGPIRSCANMISRMEPYFHFKVVTGNMDLGEDCPYEGITSDTWNTVSGGEEVYYCSKEKLTHAFINRIIQEENPDVIYLNSMFSQWFTLAPLIAAKRKGQVKVVIAPRGMLSPGALGIKSNKKRLFLAFSRIMRLFKNVIWHASTELEVGEIKKMFGHNATVIHAMNLTALPSPPASPPVKKPGSLDLVYIGRVSIVKNTLQTLQVLAKIPSTCKVTFTIYGPFDEASYLKKCEDALALLPSHVEAKFAGPVKNNEIASIISKSHFLFLLSFNENFGHAIVESLAEGRPVIISDRTPWRELEAKQCGWDLDLFDEKKIIAALQKACAMDQDEYTKWCNSAHAFATNVIRNDNHISRTKELFS
jgi:glycosyltransferase involved in cell wall biosynthesis